MPIEENMYEKALSTKKVDNSESSSSSSLSLSPSLVHRGNVLYYVCYVVKFGADAGWFKPNQVKQ